jgi:hypothetical protein
VISVLIMVISIVLSHLNMNVKYVTDP